MRGDRKDLREFFQIGRLSLSKQLLYFQTTRHKLKSMFREESARQYVVKSIFCVTIAANNYLLPVPLTYLTPHAFQDKLIRQQLTVKSMQSSRDHLKVAAFQTLYNLGARRIIVTGVGPIGCIPYQLTLNLRRDGSCVPSANKLALDYNSALEISSWNSTPNSLDRCSPTQTLTTLSVMSSPTRKTKASRRAIERYGSIKNYGQAKEAGSSAMGLQPGAGF
ncbi:hypothetical protein SELMODRAFT_423586 [Selaginella moellendorffii]|uniref:Uncharacterized protein n=1 Tax=Selaginella moellendorffii TaxID=88036 RepID=D8SM63_SELML|nr:hypothetical protein SELMODRAFT_423586 [Selaginella moellendorffii]